MSTLLAQPVHSPAILWIDPVGAEPTALGLGRRLRTDVVGSMSDAFARLSAGAYDAVVIDFSGVGHPDLRTVVELRAEKRRTPILVFAPGADATFAMDALRSGASYFCAAGFSSEAVALAVHRLVAPAGPDGAFIDELRTRMDRASAVRTPGVPLSRARRALMSALTAGVGNRQAGPRLVWACAAALRSVLRTQHCAGPREQAGHARRVFDRRLQRTAEAHLPGVRLALQRLQEFVCGRRQPKQYEVAAAVGLDAGHLGRLLKSDTGLTFCEWRTAVRLMLTARDLVETSDYVAQIAYRFGFEHPSQFAREFTETVGTSPRGYRQLSAALSDFEPED
jgi:AraC-like DNA-binding protein/DNA-binding NarL/FixJ family response regulator